MSAITPNTEVRLLKCPIEADNRHQIDFASSTAQYNYFNSLTHLTVDNFTYQRQDSVIRFPRNIDDIIEYNYVMYKNDNYGNKWFYAFITDMTYVNDNMTSIKIKTDVYQTWQFNITLKQSFVEREHVNDDTVGKHTIPENLETGEYICNTSDGFLFNDLCFLLQASETVSGDKLYATNVNGIWQSGGFYKFTDINQLINVVTAYTKPDVIKNVYIVPSYLVQTETSQLRWHGSASPVFTSKTITKQVTLDGYTPVNNKLLCYPYNYLLETNNNGASNVFKWEGFASNPLFSIGGCATVGASIVSAPTNYKEGDETNILVAGKFPTCSWSEDAYTNWLTMNSVNVLGIELNPEQAGYIGSLAEIGIGLGLGLAGNPVGGINIGQGIAGIFGAMQSSYQHKLIPDTFKGNINGGDFQTGSGTNGFYFYKMSIKNEIAKSIDKYFSMYGYKVNIVKVPNVTGRTNWNYVKTIGANIEGNIPQKDMEEIKNMFDNGITFWHKTNKYLDYSESNNIVT